MGAHLLGWVVCPLTRSDQIGSEASRGVAWNQHGQALEGYTEIRILVWCPARSSPAEKALRGFGGRSVLEIVAPYRTDAYRAVYTVRFHDAIYVLHAFQKKSTIGIATSRQDMDLISQRLAAAELDHRERQTS
jgi:phage-related protein